MKNISIVCSLLVVILLTDEAKSGQTVDKEKLKEMAAGLLADCRSKVGASEDDMKMIQEKRMPTTPEGQCLIECVFNAANIMKDGSLYKLGAIQAFTPGMNGDQSRIAKMKNMVETCDKELKKESDRCKNAKAIVECVVKHGKEFDFKFPTHMR